MVVTHDRTQGIIEHRQPKTQASSDPALNPLLSYPIKRRAVARVCLKHTFFVRPPAILSTLATILLMPFLGTATPQMVEFTDPEGGVANAPEGWLTVEWAPVTAAEKWEPGGKLAYELQQASTPDFSDVSIRYRGPDSATFVSGLPEGVFYFRIRSFDADKIGPWSGDPLTVHVNYVAPEHVVMLLALGGVVFVATVAAILRGHHRCNTGRKHFGDRTA